MKTLTRKQDTEFRRKRTCPDCGSDQVVLHRTKHLTTVYPVQAMVSDVLGEARGLAIEVGPVVDRVCMEPSTIRFECSKCGERWTMPQITRVKHIRPPRRKGS